uniref:Uncharacterized protein n=1 Tax=Timema tahoe TaxID=61484 RepID=A0A7R9IFG5_9NEOP|nr:unnamed protein product [Timema tahoe]
MPESLTMKRIIKKRLKTASQNSKHRPISLWKRFKYRLSMSWTKFNLTIKTVLYSFELWYSSLKVIEGHFGSSVATYFRFLRWLFILNTIVLVLSNLVEVVLNQSENQVRCSRETGDWSSSLEHGLAGSARVGRLVNKLGTGSGWDFSFIVIPQLLYRLYEGEIVTVANETNSNTSSSTSQLIQEELNTSTIQVTSLPFTTLDTNNIFTPKLRANPYGENSKFTFGNLLTGEGFFTNTTLYYGYYTNNSVQLIGAASYSMPNAYFFTMVVCYLLIFITLSISMATSYRRSFIETSGGLQNVFSHKVFCGWDFSIATVEAATLKSKNIYNELKYRDRPSGGLNSTDHIYVVTPQSYTRPTHMYTTWRPTFNSPVWFSHKLADLNISPARKVHRSLVSLVNRMQAI